ncbi:CidA/LrgA family protein, partial [Priestia megaterium]|uniref:CidA/LrgA family protein n=1 Tax=Priestia megaterium TaxID=1404 RepID=UPI0022A79A10
MSHFVPDHLPFPIPASLIPLLLLFLPLSFNIIKLHQLQSLPTPLTSFIPFLFLPPPISLINSLPLIQHYAIQISLLIILPTIIFL